MRQVQRIDWADYAKGICIVFVVMWHTTLGVEAASGEEGWLHPLVAFARPFRMPDFFLVSGLFLGRVIGRDWRTYLDRKVVHFAYFYLLWLTIEFAFKAPFMAASNGWAEVGMLYLLSFVEPFGILWFIYLLPIFFVVTKLARRVPVAVVWVAAAVLETAQIDTGWNLLDKFCLYFVYFYTGYVLAPRVFALARSVQAHPVGALGLLGVWGLVNGFLVAAGHAHFPLVSLALGLTGAAAVVSAAALMAKANSMRPLEYCGRHSIVIYLAFFLPMAATRTLLVHAEVVSDVGTISAIVTVAALLGSLALYWSVRATSLRFLFERPAMFWLMPKAEQAGHIHKRLAESSRAS